MSQHQIRIVECFLQQNQIEMLIFTVDEVFHFFIFKPVNVGIFHKHHADDISNEW